MATVVNNPGTSSNSGNMVLTVILVLLVLLLVLYFAMPYFRGSGAPQPASTGMPAGDTIENNIEQVMPSSSAGTEGENGLNIEIPREIDVNVNPGMSSAPSVTVMPTASP